MKKNISLITICLFILVIIITGVILINDNTKEQTKVCFQNHCFDVELAAEPQKLSRGLMFREQLDLDKGMLFIFEKEGEYPFWMKNTLIPLDIIWINENKEVVFISDNTQPCEDSFCPSINPEKNARYVLEINGGISRKINLVVGDKMNFEIE